MVSELQEAATTTTTHSHSSAVSSQDQSAPIEEINWNSSNTSDTSQTNEGDLELSVNMDSVNMEAKQDELVRGQPQEQSSSNNSHKQQMPHKSLSSRPEAHLSQHDRTERVNCKEDDTSSSIDKVTTQCHRYAKSTKQMWDSLMGKLRDGVSFIVLKMARFAAINPWITVIGSLLLSFGLLGLGFATNFEYNVSPAESLTPKHSVIREQKQWILEESGFPPQPLSLRAMLHREGDNVVTQEGVQHMFQVLDMVEATPNYQELCDNALEDNELGYGGLCHIRGISLFWNHSRAIMEEKVNSDVDVILSVNTAKYPDGSEVDQRELMGHMTYHNDVVVSAESLLLEIVIPASPADAKDLSEAVLDTLLDLKRQWASGGSGGNGTMPTSFRLEVYLTDFSLESETLRAVFNDLPLIPTVFVIMALFTCLIFSTSHKPGDTQVKQRIVLGMGAVVAVVLSLATSYGLLYTIGIPFTSLTQILPFVMFGIGLDDAFIIFGEYVRTDTNKDPVERINDTFEEIGLSIFLTTLTTSLAFMLGCLASLPTLYWLSLYAFPTVLIDFVYQTTFFVAMIVLDERRIERKRQLQQQGYCVCACIVMKKSPSDTYPAIEEEASPVENDAEHPEERAEQRLQLNDSQDEPVHSLEGGENSDTVGNLDISTRQLRRLQEEQQNHHHYHLPGPPASIMDRWMKSYANVLLMRPVKIFVLLVFLALSFGCVYSATHFTQEFNIYEVLSSGSYVADFFGALEKYADRGFVVPQAYFRNVDQSDPAIQQQMETYVNDLVEIDAITEQPPYFWLRHFNMFIEYDERLTVLDFNTQMALFLSVPVFQMLYGDHIVRDPETNDVIASRCVMYMDNLDMESVDNQIQAWRDQLDVTKMQPVNDEEKLEGEGEFNFFLYEGSMIYVWEFYAVLVDELILSTILGVATVSGVSFLFLPHWTAALFLTPIISILYVDLIGFLQFFGVHLNAISYFTLIMSIGLLVDFNMHILLRYYESPCGTREGKVKDALQTMGSSVVIGGLSTFLGVLPLVFSTSDLMKTLFFGFWGMVLLGCSHGVILLPVILSYVGPIGTTPVTLSPRSNTTWIDGPKASADTEDAGEANGGDEGMEEPRTLKHVQSDANATMQSSDRSFSRSQNDSDSPMPQYFVSQKDHFER